MPTYNSEKYISDAIDSILNQSFKDFELIIVNDASQDNTKKIIEDYEKKDSRIKVINNEVNIQIGASLNKGIS
ncbi:glycosyltransferase family 2 protein, partial [Patescibacteria group bacterium]